MSRRQRKNVKKREKESENLSTTTTNNSSNCSGGTGNGNAQEGTKNQKKRSSQKNPSKFYVSLGLNDDQIYYHLLNYILDQDTLRSIGSYPFSVCTGPAAQMAQKQISRTEKAT